MESGSVWRVWRSKASRRVVNSMRPMRPPPVITDGRKVRRVVRRHGNARGPKDRQPSIRELGFPLITDPLDVGGRGLVTRERLIRTDDPV